MQRVRARNGPPGRASAVRLRFASGSQTKSVALRNELTDSTNKRALALIFGGENARFGADFCPKASQLRTLSYNFAPAGRAAAPRPAAGPTRCFAEPCTESYIFRSFLSHRPYKIPLRSPKSCPCSPCLFRLFIYLKFGPQSRKTKKQERLSLSVLFVFIYGLSRDTAGAANPTNSTARIVHAD